MCDKLNPIQSIIFMKQENKQFCWNIISQFVLKNIKLKIYFNDIIELIEDYILSPLVGNLLPVFRLVVCIRYFQLTGDTQI